MRIGLVVDSSCDLPRTFIDEHGIVVLPITVEVEGRAIVDTRDEATTRQFFREHLAARRDARTVPCSEAQVQELILNRLVRDFDYVFCITIASSRSPIFDNAQRAINEAILHHKAARQQAGHSTPFAMRVLDSENAFAGEGLIAAIAARRISDGIGMIQLRDELRTLIPQVHAYMLPRDLQHLRMRAHARGDRSVSWMQAALGNALDIKPLVKGYRNQTFPCAKLRNFESGAERLFNYAARHVESGLLVPVVTVCYAGELKDLFSLPGYSNLALSCSKHGVQLLSSMMSMSGAANVGDGALGLAFADGEHEFDG